MGQQKQVTFFRLSFARWLMVAQVKRMETAVPSSIPVVDFFKSSHIFSTSVSATPTLNVGLFFSSVSLCLSFFKYCPARGAYLVSLRFSFQSCAIDHSATEPPLPVHLAWHTQIILSFLSSSSLATLINGPSHFILWLSDGWS